ncbi:MAG: hypothetical protein IIZ17_02550 [Eubacteriaceae bacterium]|nr:hypothetical protein [Eubacteriaceae bacterium]MCR4894197.1 hypothetical protein [Eubacteriales bacterium]
MPRKDDFVDDGRTVADMSNVDLFGDMRLKKKDDNGETVYLSREEKAAMMGGVLKATLLVAMAFAVAGLLFILFCVNVWFR